MLVVKNRPLPSRAITVLHFVDKEGPCRFSQVEKNLALKPSTLDRALKGLMDEILIDATMIPETERTGTLEYAVNRRGKALLRTARAYHRALRREAKILGDLAERLDPLAP